MRGSIRAVLVLLGACSGNDAGPPAGSEVTGCGDAKLLANPSDPAQRGSWPVGARTVDVGGLTTEIWYPAKPGSDAGAPPLRYDIRDALPASEAAKIPDADNPYQDCDCARDLPLDDAHGPYPVVLFVHGTGSFRHQSLSIVTHWASRGFVVVAADHPGLYLADLLAMACGGQPPAQELGRDLDTLLAALASPSGELGFLAGHIDPSQVAVAGHSAGGGAAAMAATKPGVRVVISMAGAQATAASPALVSTLYLAGLTDGIVGWNRVRNAWEASPAPRRIAGIANGGHLVFSDLCATKNTEGQDLLQIANEHAVCGAQLAGFLFDCDPSYLDAARGWKIVNYASSSVLESTLHCRGGVDFADFKSTYPEVTEYHEAL